MQLPLYQVDAFADGPFTGNPAAVCPLTAWLPDDTLQSIAESNNLAETAFVVAEDHPEGPRWRIRWFTPTTEVPLCGHATLAAAHVLLDRMQVASDRIEFDSRSGPLTVARDGELLEVDLPASQPEPATPSEALIEGLGRPPAECLLSRYWVAVYESADDVRAIQPDFRRLATTRPVVVTAPGDRCDFVSRFFAPGVGVDEDPVTGSAHCLLTPYWAQRLDRPKLVARQLSRRGGLVRCAAAGDRVRLAGTVRPYLEGALCL